MADPDTVIADAASLIQQTAISISLITAERLRQVAVEGYTPQHDTDHVHGELASAAAAYALAAVGDDLGASQAWPFTPGKYKPGPEPLDNLVKAGALIAAEIDRIIAQEAARFAVADQQQEG